LDTAVIVLVALGGLLLGLLFFGVFLSKKKLANAFKGAEVEAKKIREQARQEADEVVKVAMKEAKDESRQRRKKFEDEAKQRRGEVNKLEKKLKQREETLEKKLEIVEKRENDAESHIDNLKREDERYKRLIAESELSLEKSQSLLQNIAKMSIEEAKEQLIKSLEDQARKDAKERIKEIEEQTRLEAEEKARSVVSLAVQRVASEYVSDSTISVVALPDDSMKGRIIGREGRNIRAIEMATGVDLIIDDTPEAVIISCFNPVRREVAKIALGRLVADGRIHPARIEETCKRVIQEFDSTIRENGEQAAYDAGITDLHPELIKYLGTLRYRTTGQQTMLQHSVETANICGIMAGEMGLNVKRAKRMGLLHDIGKAVDQETEGHHAQIAADLCRKHGEHDDVANAIGLHHAEDLVNASPYAVILHTANTLSSRRPGARREVMETYLNRLEDMEKLVKAFPGVENAYIMQAGNEVRALVSPEDVSDSGVQELANDVAFKLRQEMTFPGQVKVTIVRERQTMEFAK